MPVGADDGGSLVYGLVNQAVEDLARTLGGDALWSTIKTHAGIDLEAFVAMEPYDDAVTYRLVEAASVALDISPEAVLEAFGEHWILYTGREGYGALFSAMGSTLPQFLRNLDAMHARIALSMPQLRPPSFACEELDEERVLVRYWSSRAGLAPMVVGLLKGLGRLFELDVAVTITATHGPDSDHDCFLVTHRTAVTAVAGT